MTAGKQLVIETNSFVLFQMWGGRAGVTVALPRASCQTCREVSYEVLILISVLNCSQAQWERDYQDLQWMLKRNVVVPHGPHFATLG